MATREDLLAAAAALGTPLYVYDIDAVRARLARLREAFGSQFGISFAIKSNPNLALLRSLAPLVDTFDVSAFAEVERAIAAGCEAERITFCGPGKRAEEVRRAVRLGIGYLVVESLHEARLADRFAGELGCRQIVLLRINPATSPRAFGVNMSGKPSQFGIDEEEMEAAIDAVAALPHLDLVGFHIYSGSNSLSVEGLAENFVILSDIFRRAVAHCGQSPRKLIFGAGFGVPYLPSDEELDLAALADQVLPGIAALRAEAAFAGARLELELGRWLVGPCGWLLSSIIGAKASRGTEIRICDAGFNNHLAAYGMMGSVIRRNWRIANLSNPSGETGRYTVVGPLCTTIDTLATKLELPVATIGDVISIENSGAYGLTSSPTRFISHPEPREALLEGGRLTDASESLLNHWRLADN
ncbi:alanine racemase [Novosphingobium sp. G106]|uniref:alanine racemase n=1 Tax=Novosphingobium sp. G106 TaxID=2849500 RepID=UPI001C2D592D|nr:alanine racemase [Novosphingobium sp. G106]MBV1689600.1 alanine racemase [Novosphingobium sp. G106]